jgi:hypothetical protein
MASMTSSGTFPLFVNEFIFLPFAIVIFSTEAAKSAASFLPSFRDAGITSLGTNPLASRNLDALTQLVQPLRK